MRTLALSVLCSFSLLVGCSDDSSTEDAGTEDATPEASPPDAFIPDGARLCTEDSDCVDEVDCTQDICDPSGFCRNALDNTVCSDGVFCNGQELCDPLVGCVPPEGPESCNDRDTCTLDRCDEEMKTCIHTPRDDDDDGEVDWHCPDANGNEGTDCNDRDPRIGSLVAEICDDGIDNNCDGMDVAEGEGECGRPAHDICEDALDVSAGGVFVVDNTGAVADYRTSCAGSTHRDIVLTFTLAEPKDVLIRAEGGGFIGLALQSTCGDNATELDCDAGFPGIIRSRAVPAGTYFAIVNNTSVEEIAITVNFTDPTPVPSNETCASPVDVSAGGTFSGDFIDVGNDHQTSCGGSVPELAYTFTLANPSNVTIGLQNPINRTMAFSVRSACEDMATELRCTRGAPARSTLYSLPAGTYFILAEDLSSQEVDFVLDVTFSAPTPAPNGDLCSNAINLPVNSTVMGTLADKEDDYTTSCSFYNRDAVYEFSLTETQDVTLTVSGGTSFMYLSLRDDCANQASAIACRSGRTSLIRARNLAPGTYYAVVESFRGTSFSLELATSAPTVPTPVTNAETCATPQVIPPTGGLFSGNTTGNDDDFQTRFCGGSAMSPDEVFRLDLTTRQRVVASTENSLFDTVLYLFTGMCMSTMEVACNDDVFGIGDYSLLDRTLEPGTHYFVVDGFGTGTSGGYELDVLVLPP
ncbi:MAG: pre-peptidase C-terminal domain-containing protein [Myxococcota bacterium]